MAGIVLPSNPSDIAAIKAAIKEISDCMLRQESERDQIKDIVAMVEEKYELPKRYVTKMAKIYHKAKYDEEVADHEDFASLYETIFK